MSMPSKSLQSLQRAGLQVQEQVRAIHAQIESVRALDEANRTRIERSLERLRLSGIALSACPALRGACAAGEGTEIEISARDPVDAVDEVALFALRPLLAANAGAEVREPTLQIQAAAPTRAARSA